MLVKVGAVSGLEDSVGQEGPCVYPSGGSLSGRSHRHQTDNKLMTGVVAVTSVAAVPQLDRGRTQERHERWTRQQ